MTIRTIIILFVATCLQGLKIFAAEGVLLGLPDPAIVAGSEEDGIYYIFATGKGLPVYRSKDLLRIR